MDALNKYGDRASVIAFFEMESGAMGIYVVYGKNSSEDAKAFTTIGKKVIVESFRAAGGKVLEIIEGGNS